MRELTRKLQGGFKNHRKSANKTHGKKIDQLVDEISERSQEYLNSLIEQVNDNKIREQSPLSFIIQKSRYGTQPNINTSNNSSSLNAILMSNQNNGVYKGVGSSTGCLACRKRLYDPV